MACKRCGTCCAFVIFEVPVGAASQEEIAAQIEYYKAHGLRAKQIGDRIDVRHEQMCRHFVDKGATGKCKIYDKRPLICKVFECDESK